ncbi:MAG: SDR family oxidoreductase [Bacteroidales bacterium]
MNLFDIRNKVVLITGAAGILGTKMVEYFAEQACRVIILDRNEVAGKELEASILAKNQDAWFLYTDVLNREILEKNYNDIINKYGTIDILINAAGGNVEGATIPPDKTFFDLEIDSFKFVVDLNLFGTVLPTIVFSKIMAQNKRGSIINISSESAVRPLTRVIGYGVAKAAVTNFTKYLACEFSIKYGPLLRVNAIAPGFFITEQNKTLLLNPDGSLTQRAKNIIAHTPFGRFGNPEELLGTLHWLSSEASAFVNGTVTVIDGGFDAFSI